MSFCVSSGGRGGVKQPGGGAGGDHVLVGGVGQVDGLHSGLWRGSDVTGETLPQTEVSHTFILHKAGETVLASQEIVHNVTKHFIH